MPKTKCFLKLEQLKRSHPKHAVKFSLFLSLYLSPLLALVHIGLYSSIFNIRKDLKHADMLSQQHIQ